jgi:hypothetical protein
MIINSWSLVMNQWLTLSWWEAVYCLCPASGLVAIFLLSSHCFVRFRQIQTSLWSSQAKGSLLLTNKREYKRLIPNMPAILNCHLLSHMIVPQRARVILTCVAFFPKIESPPICLLFWLVASSPKLLTPNLFDHSDLSPPLLKDLPDFSPSFL